MLLYFFNDETAKHAEDLTRLYKRLKGRYETFEFIALPYAEKSAEADELLIEHKINFPAVRRASWNGQGAEPIGKVLNRGVIPQIAVIDVEGNIVSDSYMAPDPDEDGGKNGQRSVPKQDYERPQKEIQKLLRDAAKLEAAK